MFLTVTIWGWFFMGTTLPAGDGTPGTEVPFYPHDLFMSICEIEKTSDSLEARFYLFHDDLKTALYDDPAAPEIKPEDAAKYFSEKTKLAVNGQPLPLEFQNLEYRKEQVRLVFQTGISSDQKIEKIELTNHLLLEYFPTQVNMVYFVKNDGERLVKMLDAHRTEAVFELGD